MSRLTGTYVLRAGWKLTCLLLQVCGSLSAQSPLSEKHFRIERYPDFPEGHSTWGDIGYNPVDRKVYVGVTNHADKVALYSYETGARRMEKLGLIHDLAFLRDYQWQGKIHTKIIFDKKGNVIFGTDGGENRQEYLMEHPRGYSGGYLMKWDIASRQLTNWGIPMQYESLKDVEIDPETGKIYAISYPQVHFLEIDPAENKVTDHGRLGSSHVPRVLFTDFWGNCYYVDWRQRLVKFEKSTGRLVFAGECFPAFPGTPGGHIITGITSFARDDKNKCIYFITYGSKVIRFTPARSGIGKIEDLGCVYEIDREPRWGYYVPNLNLGANGKLYYIIGGHGHFAKKDLTILMELDPATRKQRILYEFPLSEMVESTGSDIRDANGNLYFAGRKHVKKAGSGAQQEGEVSDYTSSPFLFIFNPEKPVQ